MPATRAARMNSRVQTAFAEARVTRAKTGTLKMPMAMIELTMPGPKSAVSMMAESTAGKAKVKSESRITTSSTQPLRAAASVPSAVPTTRPIATAITPTRIEFLAPAMISESTSRPSASVPNQCWPEGRASLCGMSMLGRRDRASRRARARPATSEPGGRAPRRPRGSDAAGRVRCRMPATASLTADAPSGADRSPHRRCRPRSSRATTSPASSITQSRTTIRSRLLIAWKIRRPRPGR